MWGIHRDRWIPRTKGQLRGKCFHLMTSSCLYYHQKSMWANFRVRRGNSCLFEYMKTEQCVKHVKPDKKLWWMRAQSQKHVLKNQQEYQFAIITKPGVMLNDILTVHLYHIWKLIRLVCTYWMSCDTGFQQHPRCYPTVNIWNRFEKIFLFIA